jgi:hypothetical protein
MATGVQNAFSTTAASNGTADSTIVASEGQGPGTLNDSIRAFMVAVKKWCLDWQGSLVTGGGATAYTVTTNEVLSLVDGISITCRMHATNGATPTLNVDSTGAKAIQSALGTGIPTAALLLGSVQKFTYYANVWIVNGVNDPTTLISAASETVAGKVELATTAEATTGTDTARAVTPAGLKAAIDVVLGGVSAAYDTLAEIVAAMLSLATQADATAGSDNAKYMSPLRVRQAAPNHAYAEYATNSSDITTPAIPIDNTIPQITEGTQILSVAHAPRRTDSRVRATFRGMGFVSNSNWVAAMFAGAGPDAVRAGAWVCPSGSNGSEGVLVYEYAPGSVSSVTWSVNVSGAFGAAMRMNGTTSGRLFGGVAAATLHVEELL